MKAFFVVQKFTRTLGASEDLIVAAAPRLGTGVSPSPVWLNFRPPENDPRVVQLRKGGCEIHHPNERSLLDKVMDRLNPAGRERRPIESLRRIVAATGPDVVIVNQGGNSDAWSEMLLLREMGVRYVVLCHSAADWTWPDKEFSALLRRGFLGAVMVCFVSEMIRELTESQIGSRIPGAAIVRSPCKIAEPREAPWPDDTGEFRLACVARLDARTKGQDLILQALSRPRWKNRPLSVTFFGDGPDRQGLESLASSLGVLSKCRFAGHVNDIEQIWRDHHGFVQPSRYEGFGLSLLEACFCGRMSVVTPFPAAREFVVEGESGFFAGNASSDALDDALDRAWSSRSNWQQMGKRAIELARNYPSDPVGDFIRLLSLKLS